MECLTTENFDIKVNDTTGTFVIKFFSDSCGPCHTMKPVVDLLENNNPKINFFEIDTGAYPELASNFGVRSVPHIAFCEDREVIYTKVGVTPVRDLQFVLDNLNDSHFRETGEFKKSDSPNDYIFKVIIGAILLVFVALYYFL